MKKQILFLVSVFVIALSTSAQGPIQPYVEDQYSISQVKEFALSSTPLAKHWRDSTISIVNAGLVYAHINLNLDERHISWILDQVEYEYVDLPAGYINSYKSPGGYFVIFTNKTKEVKGIKVGVFKYKNLRIILFKAACMNLLKIKPQVVVEQNNPTELPVEKTPIQLPIIPVAPMVQEDAPTLPKNLGELRTAILSTPTPVQQPIIPSVKRNLKPVLIVGGITVATVGLSYLAYTFFKDKPTSGTPGGAGLIDGGTPGGADLINP